MERGEVNPELPIRPSLSHACDRVSPPRHYQSIAAHAKFKSDSGCEEDCKAALHGLNDERVTARD